MFGQNCYRKPPFFHGPMAMLIHFHRSQRRCNASCRCLVGLRPGPRWRWWIWAATRRPTSRWYSTVISWVTYGDGDCYDCYYMLLLYSYWWFLSWLLFLRCSWWLRKNMCKKMVVSTRAMTMVHLKYSLWWPAKTCRDAGALGTPSKCLNSSGQRGTHLPGVSGRAKYIEWWSEYRIYIYIENIEYKI